jgi:hypothetical protein
LPLPATFTPEPARTAIARPSPTPADSAPTSLTGPDISSLKDIQTVELPGKQFTLQFVSTGNPVHSYEYYPAGQSPEDWIEMVEFQVYPLDPKGGKPIDYAKRTAAAFMQQYPDMKYALLSDKSSPDAILDLFYPTSTRKEPGKDFLEFDAYKFFKDTASASIICLHYARNIEDISATRPAEDVSAEIKQVRKDIETALAKFRLAAR